MADDRIRWDEKPVRLGKKGFVTWKTAMNELNKRVGLLRDLKTNVKTSIVNAINGLHDKLVTLEEWVGQKSEFTPTTPMSNLTQFINYLFTIHPAAQNGAIATKTVRTTIPSLPAHTWCSTNIVEPTIAQYKAIAQISTLDEYVSQTAPETIATVVCDANGKVYNFTDTDLTNVSISTVVIYANFGHFSSAQ